MAYPPLIDALLADRYRVMRALGEGGMARVFEAYDELLQRRVAIKLLHDRLAQDTQFVERFWREARAAAALNDPGIVHVYDVGGGIDDGVAPWIVMELVDGETLRELLDREGRPARSETIALFGAIVRAIAHAHERGIVHRDIKPQNIVLDESGATKVADFGIARMVDAGATITDVGAIVGTAQYLSPEQATGGRTTTASDVYSLGVLLFELLTGTLPFTGGTPVEIAYRHAHESPPAPSEHAAELEPEIDSLVLGMLEKDPQRRPADAGVVLAQLSALDQSQATTLLIESAPTQVISPRARRRALPRTLLAAAAFAAVAGLLWASSRGDDAATAPTAGTARSASPPAVDSEPSAQPARVEVPDLTSLSLTEARDAAKLAQLTVAVANTEQSKDVPDGEIISQDPAPGESVTAQTPVAVTLSRGDAKSKKEPGAGKEKGGDKRRTATSQSSTRRVRHR